MNRKLLRKTNHFMLGVRNTVVGLPQVWSISKKESYFPEYERKKLATRIFDNLLWLLRFHEVDSFYNMYGFDVKNGGNSPKDYIDNFSFPYTRNACKTEQYVLLKDKLMFASYLSSYNVDAGKILAVWKDGTIYKPDFSPMKRSELSELSDYFLKENNGECASYVKHIRDYNDFCHYESELKNGNIYIFQQRVFQHDEMKRINPSAINTLRIVTVNKDGKQYLLTALLRIGTSKSGVVDNWAAGGIAVGVKPNGTLKQYGYYKPCFAGGKTDIHPDTGVVFSEFRVPFFQEAVKMACDAHRFFYGVRTIGWDVAITPNGPVIIEGNDNWEISLQQVCDRPLKAEWNSVIR